MTRDEKQKAIDALKISAPVMAVTQEEFTDYIQTLNQVMDWLEQEPETITEFADRCRECGARYGKLLKQEPDMYIPFLIHKEMEIPISECQKAYDVAIDYLRSQANIKGGVRQKGRRKMQIVIDIPEYIYKLCQGHGDIVYNYVGKGKPLPKGHGRILDEKDILDTENNDGGWYDLVDMPEYIAGVKAIIEADKEEE